MPTIKDLVNKPVESDKSPEHGELSLKEHLCIKCQNFSVLVFHASSQDWICPRCFHESNSP